MYMNGTFLFRISAPPNNKLHELGVLKFLLETDLLSNDKTAVLPIKIFVHYKSPPAISLSS